MNRISLLMLFAALALVSCRSNEFIKTSSGLQYKIIKIGTGDKINPGEVLKLQVRQIYNDSLLSDTRKTLPQYQVFDSSQLSKDAYLIFGQVHTGDSLVFKVSSDSAFKASKPSFVRKYGWLITCVKVEAIFKSQEEAKVDYEMEKLKRKESKNVD